MRFCCLKFKGVYTSRQKLGPVFFFFFSIDQSLLALVGHWEIWPLNIPFHPPSMVPTSLSEALPRLLGDPI